MTTELLSLCIYNKTNNTIVLCSNGVLHAVQIPLLEITLFGLIFFRVIYMGGISVEIGGQAVSVVLMFNVQCQINARFCENFYNNLDIPRSLLKWTLSKINSKFDGSHSWQ